VNIAGEHEVSPTSATACWHVYAVPVGGGPARDLTPLRGVNARILELGFDEPNVIAVALNDRDKAWHDIYRIDIATGARELLYENRKELAEIVLDRQLRPRLAVKTREREGGHIVFRVVGSELEPIMVVEHEDDLTTRLALRKMRPRFIGSPRWGETRPHCLPGIGRRVAIGC
jgi:hypothetical protein